jgi:hypothetical protein
MFWLNFLQPSAPFAPRGFIDVGAWRKPAQARYKGLIEQIVATFPLRYF